MWKGKVLIRTNDPDGFIYHAYAVSSEGVHDREGRYCSEVIALKAAESLAGGYNLNSVDENKPFGHQVLNNEQGNKPWRMKRGKKHA
jgi:hypothetical protein